MRFDAVPGQLLLEKLTNGFDADEADGADVPEIAVGDDVDLGAYVVTNTYGVVLSDIVVSDDHRRRRGLRRSARSISIRR